MHVTTSFIHCHIHDGIHSDYWFPTYNWYLSSLKSFQRIHESDVNHLPTYAHSPCYNPHLLLTWHPPVVTGIVHLGPRLSVNCSPLFPIVPLCPPLQNPNPFSDFPEPNVHLIKARLNPLPRNPNRYGTVTILLDIQSNGVMVPPVTSYFL
jgi:hypothetical protein